VVVVASSSSSSPSSPDEGPLVTVGVAMVGKFSVVSLGVVGRVTDPVEITGSEVVVGSSRVIVGSSSSSPNPPSPVVLG
jgi:hypothetical protein